MALTKQDLLGQLVNAAESLPAEKILEALDFVGYLRDKATPGERGSARALLAHFGSFHFGPDERDQLLADIARMPASDSAWTCC